MISMKINLSQRTLIFYGVLAPFIIFGSLYNLLGIISGTSTVISFGAFALFGLFFYPPYLFPPIGKTVVRYSVTG
ncbi:hypothetical protein ACLCDV_19550 [Sphingobacterium sp. Lzh-3]|uniref:hypothetical protein n=1 Tax=Sphingobacterium sp. Lzh-3 TaxID=3382150 RepID=UPI00398D5096